MSIELTVAVVPAVEREHFDSIVRELAGVPTPIPSISIAVVASSQDSHDGADDAAKEPQTWGVAYIHVRHLLWPYVLTEGAPPDTLTKLADAISEHLRQQLGPAIEEANAAADAENAAPDQPKRELSYDIYVPHGQPAPDGFEELPVSVWRRRVC